MKIRRGFVSNSSSSSFVLIVAKEGHDEAINKMPSKQTDIVEKIANHQTIGSQELVLISTQTFDGEIYRGPWEPKDSVSMIGSLNNSPEEYEDYSEAMWVYRELLEKNKADFTCTHFNW